MCVRDQHDDVSGTRDRLRMTRAAAEGNLEILAAVWRKRPGKHLHQPVFDDDSGSLPAQLQDHAGSPVPHPLIDHDHRPARALALDLRLNRPRHQHQVIVSRLWTRWSSGDSDLTKPLERRADQEQRGREAGDERSPRADQRPPF